MIIIFRCANVEFHRNEIFVFGSKLYRKIELKVERNVEVSIGLRLECYLISCKNRYHCVNANRTATRPPKLSAENAMKLLFF